MKRIWGIDIGTTSVGFAVVDYDEKRETGAIHRLGVRIFPEGIEPVGGGKTKEPRNKKRRTARLTRRQVRRRKLRRRQLGDALAEAGLLPKFGSDDWCLVIAEARSDPYQLRARAIHEPLKPYEIGRALYHLAKRRGFRGRAAIETSDERADPEKEKEEGKATKAAKELQAQMGSRTLGEFLATQDKRRGNPTFRGIITSEFNKIWDGQAPHHPDLLTPTLRARVNGAIFAQRPTFWRAKTLGKCRLEPDRLPCPKAAWIAQRFLMLQRVNNLRLAGSNARPIDDEERAVVLGLLEDQASATFASIRKRLRPIWQRQDLPKDQKFTDEVAERGSKKNKTEMPGNATEAALNAALGDAWPTLPFRDRLRAEIAERWRDIYYRKVGGKRIEIRREDDAGEARARFVSQATVDFAITLEQAERLADMTLPTGWMPYSEPALRKLVARMEKKLQDEDEAGSYPNDGALLHNPKYAEVLDVDFPNRVRAAAAAQNRLPSHHRRMPDLRNPTVTRALTELRKVVNNLLAAHGKPDLIRIELARDVVMSRAAREQRDAVQKDQERKRKKAREELKANGIQLTGRNIEKYLLWQECGETCPYTGPFTGKKIGFDDLFGPMPRYDIEHIWPRSRFPDNSFANKTLCQIEFNRSEKKDRLPFEILSADHEKWHQFCQNLKSRNFSDSKIRRFVAAKIPSIDDAKFDEEYGKGENRLLNDTSYIATEARRFLAGLFASSGSNGLVRVQASNGRVTAPLRKQWGLNKPLHPEGWNVKYRGDHRHHAMDALVIALTNPRAVKSVAERWRRKELGLGEFAVPRPWPTIYADAEAAIKAVKVSHRVQRKVSGPLHREKPFHLTKDAPAADRNILYHYFVQRKSLDQISLDEIEDEKDPKIGIRDREIRRIIKEHIAAHGGKPKQAFPPYPTLASRSTGELREIRKVRIVKKARKDLMVPLHPAPNTYADAGENHHMELFDLGNGNIDCRVVTRFEANRRHSAKEEVVRRTGPNGGRFLMSLSIGDTLEFPGPDDTKEYRVVDSVWANGQVVLRDHREAGPQVKQPMARSIIGMGARKVNVDPIGGVRSTND